MQDNYKELLEVLQEQAAVVGELVELGLAETAAFKKDDLSRITAIVDRQQTAVDRMWALEQHKADIIEQIRSGLAPQKPEQAIANMGDSRWEMEAVGDRLLELAGRLRRINETNRLLGRMSMNLVRVAQKALGIVAGGYDEQGMRSLLHGRLGRLDASV